MSTAQTVHAQSGTPYRPSHGETHETSVVSSVESSFEDEQFFQSPDSEQNMTMKLENFLVQNDAYSSPEVNKHRLSVLGRLEAIVVDWVERVCTAQGLGPETAKKTGTRVLTFGSCCLGANQCGGDIDTVILGPKLLDRSRDVFGQPHSVTGETSSPENVLVDILRQRPEVDSLLAIPEAYVPVIKFRFENVQIDMVAAFLDLDSIPEDLELLEDGILRNIDNASQRSINGVRLSRLILKLVPDVETFQITLRAVKLWARRRGIYSNVMGYLGGVSWTLMTAKVCMMFKNEEPSRLLWRFFQLYRFWKWPQPVTLQDLSPELPELGFRVWNPDAHFSDKWHIMPVITPVYPNMNTTYNVCFSTFRVLVDEFERGYNCVLDCSQHGIDSSHANIWQPLFEETDFFRKYKYYLQIDVHSVDAATQVRWKAFIEARLRHLPPLLEELDLKQIHLHPHAFDTNPAFKSGLGHSVFFGLAFPALTPNWSAGATADRCRQVTAAVYQWFYRDLQQQMDVGKMFLGFVVLKKRYLPPFVGSSDHHRRSRVPRGRRKRNNRSNSDSSERKALMDVNKRNLAEWEQIASVKS